jgi:hypothetical protein
MSDIENASKNIVFTDEDWRNKIAIVDVARQRLREKSAQGLLSIWRNGIEYTDLGTYVSSRFRLGTSVAKLDQIFCTSTVYDLVADSQVNGLMGPMTPKISGFKIGNCTDELEKEFDAIDAQFNDDNGNLTKTYETKLANKRNEKPNTIGGPAEFGLEVKKFPYDSAESALLRKHGGYVNPKADYFKYTKNGSEYWGLAFDHDPYYLPYSPNEYYQEVLWFSLTGENDRLSFHTASQDFVKDLKQHRLEIAIALEKTHLKFISLITYEGTSGADFDYWKDLITGECSAILKRLSVKRYDIQATGAEFGDLDIKRYVDLQYDTAVWVAQTIADQKGYKFNGPVYPSQPRFLGEMQVSTRPKSDKWELKHTHAWFELQSMMLSLFASTYKFNKPNDGGKLTVKREKPYGVYDLLNNSASFVPRSGGPETVTEEWYQTGKEWTGSGSLVSYKATSGEKYGLAQMRAGLPDVVEDLFETMDGKTTTSVAIANKFRKKPTMLVVDDISVAEVNYYINPALQDVAEFLDEYKLYDYGSSESNSQALGAIYHNYAIAFRTCAKNSPMRSILSAITTSIGVFESETEGRTALENFEENVYDPNKDPKNNPVSSNAYINAVYEELYLKENPPQI